MRTFAIMCLCLLSVAAFSFDAQALKVLVLAGNISNAEFPELQKRVELEGFQFTYEQTSDRALPGLDSADILWIGQGEMCENAYFFNVDTENAIKNFVQDGGIVISIGQDSDNGRPCEAGWLPVPVLGVERGGTETFEITSAPEVDDLFTRPNQIQQAHHDDAWTDPDPSIILLSTINGGQDIGIGLLHYGQGSYLITSLENESTSDVTTNLPMIENLLVYAAELKAAQVAVEPGGKLTTLWAQIRIQ